MAVMEDLAALFLNKTACEATPRRRSRCCGVASELKKGNASPFTPKNSGFEPPLTDHQRSQFDEVGVELSMHHKNGIKAIN